MASRHWFNTFIPCCLTAGHVFYMVVSLVNGHACLYLWVIDALSHGRWHGRHRQYECQCAISAISVYMCMVLKIQNTALD